MVKKLNEGVLNYRESKLTVGEFFKIIYPSTIVSIYDEFGNEVVFSTKAENVRKKAPGVDSMIISGLSFPDKYNVGIFLIGGYSKDINDNYYESKSRTRKRSIKEDMEDKKYKAYAYLDLHRRNGLTDSIETDDFEELRDWCWEKIHDGVWLSVDNDETGSYACLELPEDAEYLDYYDLDDCIIRKDSAKEIVSFNDLY